MKLKALSAWAILYRRERWALAAALWSATLVVGCKSPAKYRHEADTVAARIIADQQKQALGRTEPFTIETPAQTLRRRLQIDQHLPLAGRGSGGTAQLKAIEHWPEKAPTPPTCLAVTRPAGPSLAEPLHLTLIQALQVGACNSRDYQSRKEDLFRAALDLDLESEEFRNTYAGLLRTTVSHDGTAGAPVGGVVGTGSATWSRRLRSGAALTGRIGLDLVRLLTDSESSSMGLFADASITIPLLRGSGRHIVTEPLTQAQRNVVYSIYSLERFKRTLAVRIAREYLGVLQRQDEVINARENHSRLAAATRRSQELAKAGRLEAIQVDQAVQNELRAKDRLVRSRDTHRRDLDSLKMTLGLPTDAKVELDRGELPSAAKQPAPGGPGRDVPAESSQHVRGRMELPEVEAIKIALAGRVDLRTAEGRVFDAQRGVVVAADALKADLQLTGSGAMGERRSVGSAGSANAQVRPERGVYSLAVTADLPWQRTAERNGYRNSLIALERATRDVQELEDQIKLQVRTSLGTLGRSRESCRIQVLAVRVAERRVASTKMFMEAGRVQIRDVLEAQESLLSAQNSLTAALVDYRVAELELQRDMGVLEVNEKGMWREYTPKSAN